MPQYLKLADKIYTQVQASKGFTDDPVTDLNHLMIELRQAVKETNFKLLYNCIDFEELLMNPAKNSIQVDISILPKSKNMDEYILWLAGFIEKITINDKKISNDLDEKIILPEYYYDDWGNIVNKSINNGEEIISYFKSNEII